MISLFSVLSHHQLTVGTINPRVSDFHRPESAHAGRTSKKAIPSWDSPFSNQSTDVLTPIAKPPPSPPNETSSLLAAIIT